MSLTESSDSTSLASSDHSKSDSSHSGASHDDHLHVEMDFGRPNTQPWYRNADQVKLMILIILHVIYMIVELAVGFATGSLALVSDGFHMASDSTALVVAFIAIQLGKRDQDSRYSFGWQRAELIGSFVNGIFLLSLCMFITLEAIESIYSSEAVENPLLVIYVSCGGIAINIIGLILLASGHGHSHGNDGHGHTHGSKKSKQTDHSTQNSNEALDENKLDTKKSDKTGSSSNIRAVFLHVLGDFMGSVAAITSGLLIYFLEFPERYYFDPSLSMLIVVLMLFSTVPLVIRVVRVLMQSTPSMVNVDSLNTELQQVSGVIAIHELHIWTLTGNTTIGTLHVTCFEDANFMKIAKALKKIMHKHGVHSTTIQPEFVPVQALQTKRGNCEFVCVQLDCKEDLCCPPVMLNPLDDEELQRLLHAQQGSKLRKRRDFNDNKKPKNTNNKPLDQVSTKDSSTSLSVKSDKIE